MRPTLPTLRPAPMRALCSVARRCRRCVTTAAAPHGDRLTSHAYASTSAAPAPAAAAAAPPPSRSALARMRVADLRALAAAAGLPTAGLKADLVARLAGSSPPAARGVSTRAAPAAPTAAAPPTTPLDPAAADTGLAVTWLGTSSGAPTPGRNVSCVAVRTPRAAVLIDAGEGSAVQLAAAGVPLAGVSAVLITHLHGDHCFGVHSVLAAVAAARAAAAAPGAPPPRVLVAGPPGLHALVLAGLRLAGHPLPVPLLVVELTPDAGAGAPPARARGAPGSVALATLAPDDTPATRAALVAAREAAAAAAAGRGGSGRGRRGPTPAVGATWTLPLGPHLTAVAAQLQHRVPCWGYSLREPAAAGGRNVVILGDTADSAAIARPAAGCDLLSHEATFAAPMAAKAAIAQHSTAAAAGAFAAAVGARRLVLTHFSGRYDVGPLVRRGGGGRGRGRGPATASDSESDGPLGRDAPPRAIEALVAEARHALARAGGAADVLAARDMMTVPVPRRVERAG